MRPLSPRARSATGAGLVVLALAAIAWLVLASPLFRIAAIDVDGNERLSDQQVLALSGARIGENLVFLSTRDVEQALESSPWIADAAIERRLPDTLVVHLAERRAVAIALGATTTFLVAGDGMVLGTAEEPLSLPSLGPHAGLVVGERIPGPLGAVRVLASLAPSVVRMIRSAGIESADGDVALRFPGGSFVRYGPATEIERKAEALEGILRWAAERGIAFRYIDVRVPESPVLRPAGRPGRAIDPGVTEAP